MPPTPAFQQLVSQRLRQERGTIFKSGRIRVALLYPSPYHVAMSSLGFQVVYRLLNELDDTVCERAFLPDDVAEARKAGQPLATYESGIALADADVIAVSLAYELEIAGLLESLSLARVPLRADQRNHRHPLVILGGPLTFSNPLPAAPFADLIVMGEAEDLLPSIWREMAAATSREDFLDRCAALAGCYVPNRHGERLLPVVAAEKIRLPAFGQIRTPNTELADMHLVEAERGCHRKCTFCVMRRSTNGGMRLASLDSILDTLPPDATRVGLVGAAVSDHPRLTELLDSLVGRGLGVGLSSLRADRLTPELMDLLRRGGYRTLTVAMDGCSERMRKLLLKEIREVHLEQAAHFARQFNMRYLKLYLMVGAPGETDADVDELVAFVTELSRISNVALGIAPFVAKRNTPLDREPFAGIREVDDRLNRIQKALRGKAEVRATSARWAWVEHALAQGGFDMADASEDAWSAGGNFAAWKAAIAKHARHEQPVDNVLRLGLPRGPFAREVHPGASTGS